MMNLYKISCRSECGSYMQPYLQSIDVIAETKQEAIDVAMVWMKENNYSFVNKDKNKWEIEEFSASIKGVIDCCCESDY